MKGVGQWAKVRAPILALLLTILGVLLSTYGRLVALEQAQRDSDVRERMMEQAINRIETRLMLER
jgi:hypothetical protein